MIEVEIRGHLIEPQTTQFKAYLDQHADAQVSYYDLAIFFATDDLPEWGAFADSKARLSANHRVYEDGKVEQHIKYKDGHAAEHGRHEYEIRLADQSLQNFAALLKRFGVTQGSFRGCDRIDYTFGDIEVSLKFGHPCNDHFEVETSCADISEVEAVKQKLFDFVAPFGFTIWTPEKYKQVIKDSMPRAPRIDLDAGFAQHIKISSTYAT